VADPVCDGEIDGLSKVVSLVEAGVVRTRERDDDLASVLVCPNHLATKRRHHNN